MELEEFNPYHGFLVDGSFQQLFIYFHFNNSVLVHLCWEAAKYLPAAASLICGISLPSLRITYCFEGTRIGHLTENVTESLNNCWIQDASGLPIIKMMMFKPRPSLDTSPSSICLRAD
ncbi:hypothetical protein YC2023_000593 [Brassica napus]